MPTSSTTISSSGSSTIAPKERPILFSGPMVRAILAGVKTQTRRASKVQPSGDPTAVEWFAPTKVDRHGEEYLGEEVFGVYGDDWHLKSPYGAPGDRLWVRETWLKLSPEHVIADEKFAYRAKCDEESEEIRKEYLRLGHDYKWRPSIFMPREVSRIALEVTDVGFERLYDITETDAIAEGAQCAGVPASMTNRGAFAKLWESINGKDSWDANPWVWVLQFSVLT